MWISSLTPSHVPLQSICEGKSRDQPSIRACIVLHFRFVCFPRRWFLKQSPGGRPWRTARNQLRSIAHFWIDFGAYLGDGFQMIVELRINRRQVSHDFTRYHEYIGPFRKAVANEKIQMHGDDVDLFIYAHNQWVVERRSEWPYVYSLHRGRIIEMAATSRWNKAHNLSCKYREHWGSWWWIEDDALQGREQEHGLCCRSRTESASVVICFAPWSIDLRSLLDGVQLDRDLSLRLLRSRHFRSDWSRAFAMDSWVSVRVFLGLLPQRSLASLGVQWNSKRRRADDELVQGKHLLGHDRMVSSPSEVSTRSRWTVAKSVEAVVRIVSRWWISLDEDHAWE